MKPGITFTLKVEDVFLQGDKSTWQGSLCIRESNILGLLRRCYMAVAAASNFSETISSNHIDNACTFSWDNQKDPDEYANKIEKAKDTLCPTCFFFGTTGWSKRFHFKLNCDKSLCDKSKNGFSGELKLTFSFDKYSYEHIDLIKENIYFLIFTIAVIIQNKIYFTAKTTEHQGKITNFSVSKGIYDKSAFKNFKLKDISKIKSFGLKFRS